MQDSYRDRVLKVSLHIQQHLDDALTLSDVAKVAHFSEYHFHRIFKGVTGESLQRHISLAMLASNQSDCN